MREIRIMQRSLFDPEYVDHVIGQDSIRTGKCWNWSPRTSFLRTGTVNVADQPYRSRRCCAAAFSSSSGK
jgi:hypothetical protein